MQLKDFDVFTQPEEPGMALCGGFPQQVGLLGMPSDHNSTDIQYAEIFAESNSESSIGNEKIPADCNLQTRRKRSHHDDSSHEFYMTGSAITDETRVVLPSMVSNQVNASIFHAHGWLAFFLYSYIVFIYVYDDICNYMQGARHSKCYFVCLLSRRSAFDRSFSLKEYCFGSALS